jgi:predicted RNA-binding Zn ribbon-like protein
MEATSTEASEDRERAPGRLALVQDFINSLELESDLEALPDAAALDGWLRGRGLLAPDERIADGDLERARAFREALRELLVERAHGDVRAETVAALNRAADGATLRVGFDVAGAPQLAPAGGALDRFLGELGRVIAAASLDGTWSRLKVCGDDTCRWAFYDRSKNRSGAWCSMAVCGNRAKARSYRRRHRGDGDGS